MSRSKRERKTRSGPGEGAPRPGEEPRARRPGAGAREGEAGGAAETGLARWRTPLICAGLAVATLLVYAQTARFGFIAYDDDQYVYENLMVRAGLTASGIKWAFTTFFYANWHPMAWVSHMLDCQLFGLDAGAHHAVNVAIHAASTLVLFLALARATRRPWRSAAVAAVFALHPLHVESVAWITERKDVLSTLFGLLALLFHVRYAERPSFLRWLPVGSFFALSLLAKPMLVTLPFVLLLLDYWPLGRLDGPHPGKAAWRLVLEKVPLLGMVVVSSVLTFVAQSRFGAVATLADMPLSLRVANAAISYAKYLGKAFWPEGMGVLYPVRAPRPEEALAAAALLAVVTAVAAASARRRPYLLVGWLWYLGMLVPVIGLVQVGVQALADRYMYLPIVGVTIALVWGLADLVEWSERLRVAVAVAFALLVLVPLGLLAHEQTSKWRSSRVLFEHTLAITEGNYIIHNNLGVVISAAGEQDEAVAHFRKAIAIKADYANAHANLGRELMKMGRFDEALPELEAALRTEPDLPQANSCLGILRAAKGDFKGSAEHLEKALRGLPSDPDVHNNLGFVLQRVGRVDEAVAHCDEALRLSPGLTNARFNRGTALALQGKRKEAAAEFSRVLEAKPDNAEARAALARVQGAAGS